MRSAKFGSATTGRSRRWLRLGAGLAVAAMLAGCGEAVRAPDVEAEMPTRWREAPRASAAEMTGDWVAGFGSAELSRLVASADLDNLDVAAARARIDQAEAQLTVTAAGLAPTVSGSAESSHSVTPGTMSSASPPFKSRVGNSHQLGLGASWQVDLWGRTRASVRASEASLAATRIDLDAVRLSTATALVDTYLQAAAAEDRLKLAREDVAIAERTLAAIRRRFDVGTVTALDLAQQEGVLATQRAAIPDLEITLRQTRNAVVVLTGRAPEAATIRGGGLDRLRLPRVAPGLPSRLLVRRPDVAAAELRLEAAAANVEAARAAFLPEVGLTGSAGLSSAFLKNLLRPEAFAGSIAASVTETIFDGGAREGRLALTRAQHAELAAGYRKAVHEALADVENALVAVEQNRRREALQTAVVTAARKAQRLTEQRLSEGTIPITTVLDAQRTLFQAEDTLVAVRLARFRASVGLVAALGGGWTKASEAEVRAVAAGPMVLGGTE
ncbi:efflux transporter outer membrane subunit [Pinisolibacter sp.]|uniref:efflux transporter outer membrane subunit n=1 Tax=Pinisolibacter sp. TaxID=2172024 RepID=UPI002FDEDF8E